MEDELIFDFSAQDGVRRVCVKLADSATARRFKLSVVSQNLARLTKPRRAARADAIKFLKENLAWLEEKTADATPRKSLLRHLEDSPVCYVGADEWRVWLKPTVCEPFTVEDPCAKEVVFAYSQENPEESLVALFIKFARKNIEASVKKASDECGIGYSAISVRNQSGRWASRSSSGTMSFNWRIPLLKPELQKYVILHELAHARFMDHSNAFWIFLNGICPNALRLDKRLSREGATIFVVARQ